MWQPISLLVSASLFVCLSVCLCVFAFGLSFSPLRQKSINLCGYPFLFGLCSLVCMFTCLFVSCVQAQSEASEYHVNRVLTTTKNTPQKAQVGGKNPARRPESQGGRKKEEGECTCPFL